MNFAQVFLTMEVYCMMDIIQYLLQWNQAMLNSFQ